MPLVGLLWLLVHHQINSDMKESEAMLLRIVYFMNRSSKLTENVTVQGLM